MATSFYTLEVTYSDDQLHEADASNEELSNILFEGICGSQTPITTSLSTANEWMRGIMAADGDLASPVEVTLCTLVLPPLTSPEECVLAALRGPGRRRIKTVYAE